MRVAKDPQPEMRRWLNLSGKAPCAVGRAVGLAGQTSGLAYNRRSVPRITHHRIAANGTARKYGLRKVGRARWARRLDVADPAIPPSLKSAPGRFLGET